jgi:acid phosphatase
MRIMTLVAVPAALLALPLVARAADPVPQNDLLNATLWVERSVEYQANTLAMYQLAKIRLDEALADKSWTAATEQTGNYQDLPPAIILDGDETVIDNGAYESWLVKVKQDYATKTWNTWVADAKATAIPGAVDFTKYADSKGVKVFYVTNRTADQEVATRANMQALGFPMGDNVDTFLMNNEKPDWTSKKGTRRSFVAQNYRVLLLVGDNYGDFSDDYPLSEADRSASLQKNIAHVGHDWIMIANPEYGSFEQAPFLADFSKSPDQRRQIKIDDLPNWPGAPQQ